MVELFVAFITGIIAFCLRQFLLKKIVSNKKINSKTDHFVTSHSCSGNITDSNVKGKYSYKKVSVPYYTDPSVIPQTPPRNVANPAVEAGPQTIVKSKNDPIDFVADDKGFETKKIFTPEESTDYRFKILNTPSGRFVRIQEHYVENRTLYCSKKFSHGKWIGSCPVCDYLKSQPYAHELKPVTKYCYNIALLDKHFTNRPVVWKVNDSIHTQMKKHSTLDVLYYTGKNVIVSCNQCDRERFTSEERYDFSNIETTRLEDLQRAVDQFKEKTGLTVSYPSKYVLDKHAKGEILKKGDWVLWKTQSGTVSVRPSIVYAVNKEQVKLKYKSKSRYIAFWVNKNKCKKSENGIYYERIFSDMFNDYQFEKKKKIA